MDYDPDTDILYIKLKDGDYYESISPHHQIILDLSRKNELLGIEIWNASKIIKQEKKE